MKARLSRIPQPLALNFVLAHDNLKIFTHLTVVDAGVAGRSDKSELWALKPIRKMSHNPGVMHAVSKAAETKGDEARQEIIETCNRMAARCEEWLAANGVALNDEPLPGMSDIHFASYTRRVNVPANVPANAAVLESLNEVYVAEGALLNNTQRALMEHHLRFDKDPDDPGYFSIPEQIKAMQAMAASVRAGVFAGPKVVACMLTCAAERPMS